MEFDLYHGISLRPGTFNALLAPRTVVLPALNSTDKFRRSMILFTGSSPAGLLSAISGTSPGFDVQLAATAHQLRAVLSNAGHTIVFVEHDPLLYEGDDNLIRSTARALRDLAGTALVILYTDVPDRSFDLLCLKADRVFFFASALAPAGDETRKRNRDLRSSADACRVPLQNRLEVS